MTRSTIRCLFLFFATAACAGADDRITADKAALAPFQQFVGSWRGVGQPRRGSSQGAWTETADWAWKFAEGRAALVFDSPKGKYYRSGKLMPGEAKGQFKLTAKRADESGDDQFSGSRDANGRLVLVAVEQGQAADMPARVTIHTVAAGDRLLVLYEKRSGAADRFVRLAEVGSTRVGAAFAKGPGEPECVVTGGLGTIAVQHQGKTYYVCCTGCRDLFNEDPEGALAEYRQRKAAEAAK